MSKTLTTENQAIVEAIRRDGAYIDDHGGHSTLGTYMFLVYEDVDRQGAARQSICPAHANTYFTINPTHLDCEGRAHLGKWSIGGVVDEDPTGQGRKDLAVAERCRLFNEVMKGADPRLGPFGRVTGVVYFSGPLKPKVTWL